jgi:hypothetical protein
MEFLHVLPGAYLPVTALQGWDMVYAVVTECLLAALAPGGGASQEMDSQPRESPNHGCIEPPDASNWERFLAVHASMGDFRLRVLPKSEGAESLGFSTVNLHLLVAVRPRSFVGWCILTFCVARPRSYAAEHPAGGFCLAGWPAEECCFPAAPAVDSQDRCRC